MWVLWTFEYTYYKAPQPESQGACASFKIGQTNQVMIEYRVPEVTGIIS